MLLVDGLRQTVRPMLKLGRTRPSKPFHSIGGSLTVLPFQRQAIIRWLIDDFLSAIRLTSQRLQRHPTACPIPIVQSLSNGAACVPFRIPLARSQHHTAALRPSPDPLQRPSSCPGYGLAVAGHPWPAFDPKWAGDPFPKPRLKGFAG